MLVYNYIMGSSCMKNNEVSKKKITKITSKIKESNSEFILGTSGFIGMRKGPIADNYTIISKLGSGAFGSVKLALHNLSGQKRAIKTIKKQSITNEMREKAKFFWEVDILKKTDHPNILKLYEFYEDEQYYHLVLEHVAGGELFDFIVQSKHLSESIAAEFMRQILSAVAYCHKNNIVHRDLKPQNLLIDKDSNHLIIKVADFGTSTIIDPRNLLNHKYGTAYYVAPEVLSRKYNEKCDIWSCGVILYIILSGKPPFDGNNEKEILTRVMQGHFSLNGVEWSRVSSEAKTFISKMLKFDPDARISADEALKDPWILGLVENGDSEIFMNSLNALKSFHAEVKLEYAILSFITFQLVNKEEARELSRTFSVIDKNKDGKLSQDELLEAYTHQMGKEAAIEEVKKIMQKVDFNHSGYIDFTEFITACSAKEKLLSKENIEAAFRILDADNSGKIIASELNEFLSYDTNVKKEVWDDLIREVDQNGDGEIDIEEFKNMMINYLNSNRLP
jgi:calcium-dependent protein kinase